METTNPFSPLVTEPVENPQTPAPAAPVSPTTAVPETTSSSPNPKAERDQDADTAKSRRAARRAERMKKEEKVKPAATPIEKKETKPKKSQISKKEKREKPQGPGESPKTLNPINKDKVITGIKTEQVKEPVLPKPSKTDRKLLEPFAPGKEITPHMCTVFKNVLTDIRASYVPIVRPEDVDWFKKLYGREPKIDTNGSMHGINPHERLAAQRKMACIDQVTYVLAYNPMKSLKERSVDFVYGTQSRDDSTMRTINTALALAGFGSEAEPCILHHIIGEQLVPGDMTRRVGGFGVRSKIAIFMDVYALGTYRMHPASIAGMGYDLWIWCGHVFNGPYGSYSGAIWCREGIDFSQVWYKPDASADAYTVHDACDIMHRPGRMTHGDTSVVWTSITKINTREGPEIIPVYNLVLGQNSDKEFLDQHSKNMQPIDVVMLKVKCPIVDSSWNFINNTVTPWLASVGVYKTRTLPISSAIYSDLKQVCVARFYNQWTFAAVLTDVNKYFSNLPWFVKLETALPQKFVNYRYEVASALYTEFCEAKKQNLLITRAIHGSDMQVANEQFKVIGSEPPKLMDSSITKKAIFIGTGILLAYLAYRKVKQQPLKTIIADVVKTPAIIGFSYPKDPTPLIYQFKRLFDNLGSYEFTPVNVPFISDFVNENIGQRIHLVSNDNLRRFIAGAYLSFIGPCIEESIKHVIPSPLIKSLISVLFANLDYSEGTKITLSQFMLAYLKHFIFSLLPLDTGIVLHCMANITSFAYYLRNPTNDVNTNCIGLNPCLKALLAKRMCEGRIIADSETFANLTEFRRVAETNPIYILNSCTIPFDPKTESYTRSTNALTKYPEALDSTISLRTPNISYANFQTDTNISGHDSGYYNIFAVSRMQYRPAANGYNTHMMLVNRLMKAPPKRNLLMKYNNRFQVRLADPHDVYGNIPQLEMLLENILDKISEGRSGIIHYRVRDRELANFRGYNHDEYAYGIQLSQIISRIESDEGFMEWLKHLHGVKQSMYRHYRLTFQGVEVTLTSRCVTRIDVSIKSDETLLKFDWVPRPVHRVDPQFACYVGPHIYAASEAAKSVYWFFPIMYEGWLITLTFGSSLNDEGLTAWFYQARNDSCMYDKYSNLLLIHLVGMVHILVAGDDVLIVISETAKFNLHIIEADVSQCDHSTRYAHLQFEWSFLRLFGVSKHIIRLLQRNACAELRIRMPHLRNEYVAIDRGHERNTGGTDTTIGNSTCIGHSWVAAIIDQLTDSKDQKLHTETWHDIMLDNYGFEMKIHEHRYSSSCYETDTGTFLKGTWWHVQHDDHSINFRWGPLLSRLLKLSKVMTRPMSICRQNAPKCFPRHNEQATIQELWYCMAQMVKAMEQFVWIPPVRTWFESLKIDYAKFASKHKLPEYDRVIPRSEDVAEYYKVKASRAFDNINATMCPCWRERVANRYHVSLEQLDSWCYHLQLVRPGIFSVHPFWEALALVDYC